MTGLIEISEHRVTTGFVNGAENDENQINDDQPGNNEDVPAQENRKNLTDHLLSTMKFHSKKIVKTNNLLTKIINLR